MEKEKWSLEEVTSQYMGATARNTPQKDLDWFLAQHSYTPESFKLATERQGGKDKELPPEELEQGGGFWNTVMDGVTYFNKASDSMMTGRTFGLSVPARAKGRWAKKGLRSTGVVPFMDEQPAEWPLESLAAVQAEDKRFADENPKTACGSCIQRVKCAVWKWYHLDEKAPNYKEIVFMERLGVSNVPLYKFADGIKKK